MRFMANLLIFIIVLLHLGFMLLEMFYWNHSLGQQIFNMTAEFAAASEVLAKNQGLYNGFLAAGLLWGLMGDKHGIKIFFLCCILVAGIFGGLTAKISILYIQALPALIALLLVMRSKRRRAGEARLFS